MAVPLSTSGLVMMATGAQAVCASSVAGALRFVQRGDKRILQQEWITTTKYSDSSSQRSGEWRDVPLVDEPAQPAKEN